MRMVDKAIIGLKVGGFVALSGGLAGYILGIKAEKELKDLRKKRSFRKERSGKSFYT